MRESYCGHKIPLVGLVDSNPVHIAESPLIYIFGGTDERQDMPGLEVQVETVIGKDWGQKCPLVVTEVADLHRSPWIDYGRFKEWNIALGLLGDGQRSILKVDAFEL